MPWLGNLSRSFNERVLPFGDCRCDYDNKESLHMTWRCKKVQVVTRFLNSPIELFLRRRL